MKELLKKLNDLSISELDKIIEEARYIRRDKFHNTYEVVKVYNYDGNISKLIQKETSLSVQHTQEMEGTIGTNNIIIPKEQFTEELKKELLLKYNNVK